MTNASKRYIEGSKKKFNGEWYSFKGYSLSLKTLETKKKKIKVKGYKVRSVKESQSKWSLWAKKLPKTKQRSLSELLKK